MLLGALVGLHGSAEPLADLRRLPISGFDIGEDTVLRASLTCTRVRVEAEPTNTSRHWSEIDSMLAGSELPAFAVEGARRTFRRLGEVEAAQHGVPLDEVHFHEVGAVDAIVDIVGVWLLVGAIGPSATTVGPVGLGRGRVEAAHGTLPLPAPATLALLEGCPVQGLDVVAETCTPTGAALLVTLADHWGPVPDGTLVGSARGAGGRDPTGYPNAVTVVAIDPSTEGDSAIGRATAAVLLEANVDDATPEVLGFTIERLLASGAADAWVVPIVMKKGRPAHEVRVLCSPEQAIELRAVLLAETGSLGCRTMLCTKYPLDRSFETVEVRGQQVTIKVGPHGAKPEYEDLASLARASGVPIRQLAAETHMAFERSREPGSHPSP